MPTRGTRQRLDSDGPQRGGPAPLRGRLTVGRGARPPSGACVATAQARGTSRGTALLARGHSRALPPLAAGRAATRPDRARHADDSEDGPSHFESRPGP